MWLGSIRKDGYGRIYIASGRTELTHRVAFTLAVGPIPAGQWVLHSCDNRQCVRPSHLFLGDNAANIADRDAKGRHARLKGEQNGTAKLTAQLVRTMRRQWRDGKPVSLLARKAGVDWSTADDAIKGVTWRHVEITPDV